MLRFRSLGSGSTGNATLVEARGSTGTTRLLVDCGLGIRQLEQRLARVETQGADNARITAELKSLLPEAEQVVVTSGTDGENASTVIALVQQKAALTKEDQQRTEAWLKQRTGATRAVLLAVPAF